MDDTTENKTAKKGQAAGLRSPWTMLGAGLLLGALIVLGLRFALYSPEKVHYHANFAVYVNGQREAFKSPDYYEEVAMCNVGGITTPQQRTHMHDEENSVIHVHDHAVTWGQFFENLGWQVGANFLASRDQLYVADDTHKVHVILDGQDYTGLTPITNLVIRDKDRLLVSYGDISQADLTKEYDSVPATAAQHDAVQDPASCSGTESTSAADRFKHLLK